MPKPGSLTALGPCEQFAYVPSDFDAALKYWTETMGVGPFFLFENITLENMRYRGEPTDARFSVAMAYWNDIQIELFRPENDAPAHYNGEYGECLLSAPCNPKEIGMKCGKAGFEDESEVEK